MLLLSCMTSFIPKPSISFFVLYNCVICDCDLCDYNVTCAIHPSCFVTFVTITCDITSHLLPKFKIKKSKSENQNKK